MTRSSLAVLLLLQTRILEVHLYLGHAGKLFFVSVVRDYLAMSSSRWNAQSPATVRQGDPNCNTLVWQIMNR